jgi:hypothetical protein
MRNKAKLSIQLIVGSLIAISFSSAVCGATNPVSCPLITTETYAETPTNRDRRLLGVCEFVTLTTSEPADWRVETAPGSPAPNGTLLDPTESVPEVIFKAGELLGPAVVVARIIRTGLDCRVTFQVIPPTHVTFHDPRPIYHLSNTTGGGFLANRIHVYPDSVSFYNIEIQEDVSVGVGTGVFAGGNGAPHTPGNEWGFQFNNDLKPGNNDLVYISAPQGTVGAGTFRWAIPLLYGCIENVPEKRMGDIVQIAVADSTGDALISKGDLNVPVPLSTPPLAPPVR